MGIADFKPYPDRPAAPVTEFSEGGVPGAQQRVYLLPGQMHASAEPCRITTILGSCVAICLSDATRLAGGMNHFLLPIAPGAEAESLRYADHATVALLEKLMAMGCRLENIAAKIFGGSALFHSKSQYHESLGAKNVAAAIQLLGNAGIPIVAQETGGNHGRKVIFDTEEGVAWSRRV
jgi:chemotaxis protein CheD